MKYIAIFLVVFISGCSISKKSASKNIFEAGKIAQKNFHVKMPFEFIDDLAFVYVEIKGRKYKFLFDTGAPTVISSNIFKELKSDSLAKIKVTDSQGNQKYANYVKLPEVKLSKIAFTGIGAVVLDLNEFEFKCMNIDGILGANQMAKAIWKIDYRQQILEVTNDLANFDLTEFKDKIKFSIKAQKTPVVKATINKQELWLTYDTGFKGKIDLANSEIEIKDFEKIEAKGTTGVGVFGTKDSADFVVMKVPTMALGGLKLQNQIITTGHSNLIGNGLLKNYTTILDWKTQTIFLKEEQKKDSERLESFGFAYRFIDNIPTVALIFEDRKEQLFLGDRILSINGENMRNLNLQQACYYNRSRFEKNLTQLRLEIQRDDEVINLTLQKKEYFK